MKFPNPDRDSVGVIQVHKGIEPNTILISLAQIQLVSMEAVARFFDFGRVGTAWERFVDFSHFWSRTATADYPTRVGSIPFLQ